MRFGRRSLQARWLGTITGVATQERALALTFDDGPHPDTTPRLLDILERHGARATFFMIGQMAEQYPALVQRAAAAGHALGVHSWDHPSFPLISGQERRAQIRAGARALAPYGVRLFRPPYGHQTTASRLDAWRLGYQVVTWSAHASDWEAHDTRWYVDQLGPQLAPGRIVLLHDTLFQTIRPECADRGPVLAAVDELLGRWSSQYRFVTVPQLVRLGSPQRVIWKRQGDIGWLNGLQGTHSAPRQYPVTAGHGMES